VIQNLLQLLFVAFLPFPTRVLADALRSGHGAAAAAVFYGISATLMAASFNALWIYASRGGRLLRADAPNRVVAGITRSFRPGIALYATATVVGLFISAAGERVCKGCLMTGTSLTYWKPPSRHPLICLKVRASRSSSLRASQ
jgi:uncharacterized membrane protein